MLKKINKLYKLDDTSFNDQQEQWYIAVTRFNYEYKLKKDI